MGRQRPGLADVRSGQQGSGARLIAPLRYLLISNPEKAKYDFVVPSIVMIAIWGLYAVVSPRIPLFGDDGLIKFSRDLMIMVVPFLVGALVAVAIAPKESVLDSRPRGTFLYLDGRELTMRQFLCYLLGYLSFVGLVILVSAALAPALHGVAVSWIGDHHIIFEVVRLTGALLFFGPLAFFLCAVLWALYFFTDVISR